MNSVQNQRFWRGIVLAGLIVTFLGVNVHPAVAIPFGGIEFPGGVASFADAVVSFEPLFSGGPAPEEIAGDSTTAVDPSAVLGPPELSFDTDLALGRGGRITLAFVDNYLTGSDTFDPDLYIFELGPDVEDTFVEISMDGNTWVDVGKVFGSTSSIDIDGFSFNSSDRFSFVRLTDDPDEGGTSGPTVGADIDAVGAISSQPVSGPDGSAVPEPSTLWLLGVAVLGYALFKARGSAFL